MSIAARNLSASESANSSRAALAERLRKAALKPITAPLSSGQERLWFLNQLEPNIPMYNLPAVMRIKGLLNVQALEEALKRIVVRHKVLRSSFVATEAGPLQVVDAGLEFNLKVRDLSSGHRAEQESELAAIIRDEVNYHFTLSEGEVFRAVLIAFGTEEHVLIVNMHHIVSDEWSLRIVFRELQTLYRSFAEGQEAALPELAIQYTDFARWQTEALQSSSVQRQLAFWTAHLQGLEGVTELATDRKRAPEPTFRGGHASRAFSTDLTKKLKVLADQQGATSFMLLFAAASALVHRYTGLEDVVIGSPFAGRTRPELENLIGFFVNTLPLRTRFGEDPTFLQLLKSVRELTLNAASNQDLPLEKIVEALRPERSTSHMPFTRLVMVWQSRQPTELRLPGLTVEPIEVLGETAKFDLTILLKQSDNQLVATIEYNCSLFEQVTIERFLGHFEVLLESVVADPGNRVSQLRIMSPPELDQLLVKWNQTHAHYPREKCVHEIFEAGAKTTPQAPALIFAEKTLTYGQLNARANQLARLIRRKAVDSASPIAIFLGSSQDMVIGMLGILKSGRGYLPLDPGCPRQRLAVMLQDSGAQLLLTHQSLVSKLPVNLDCKVLCLDVDWDLASVEQTGDLPNLSSPDDLAYVMYTSGSTGTPKGVAVPHRAITRLVLNTNYIKLNASDRIPQVSNVAFDAATFEVWGALLNGATLVGFNQDIALSPQEFASALNEQRITAIFLTTALFNQLASETSGAFEHMHTVMAGGELHDVKWVNKVLQDRPPTRFLNVYGPTENTTFTTFKEIRAIPDGVTNLPIGKPISNTQVFILDRYRNPVPIGVPGEIYTAGDGLALGYWNHPELTREKFVPNPFPNMGSSKRMYRTGDLAKYLPDGSIEFLGRIDNQVKLRGFRVELGEIETALVQHPQIKECVVLVHGTSSRFKRLVAYCVSRNEREPTSSALRAFLEERLPGFMIPSNFIWLQRIPLSPNGKLDRHALPEPDAVRPDLETQYAGPGDEIEQQMVGIWEEVLGVRPIGIHDRFFDLGGHSLLSVKLISRMEKVFGKKIRLSTIFQAQTIDQLARIIRNGSNDPTSLGRSALVEIQARGKRPPLFLVHGAGGGMFWGYLNLSRHLGPDQPVYGFKADGLDGTDDYLTIPEMAASYVADLKQIQRSGPYYLGGYCFGGNVAFEMARQLEASGETVAFLGLMNCAPPNSSYTDFKITPFWGARFLKNLLYWIQYFRQWTPSQRKGFLKWKASSWRRRWLRFGETEDHDTSVLNAGDLVDLSSYTPEQRKLWENHIRALISYQPAVIRSKIHLFRSPGHPIWCSFAPDYGWGDLARGGVQIHVVSGAHEKILEEPCVAELGESLNGLLAAGRCPSTGVEKADPKNRALSLSPERGATLRSPESNPPGCSFPIQSSYIDHFVTRAQKSPDALAVSFGGRSQTYRELNLAADRWANELRSLGVGPEVLVGVCLQRSFELIEVLLGIWKAGGAYLPLDPAYPADRLCYMLEDSKAQVLITSKALRCLFKHHTGSVVEVADGSPRPTPVAESEILRAEFTGNELAYVIYTSGSTGNPKGVEITHRSLLNHNFGIVEAYDLRPQDRVLQFTPISFDISVEEIFPTLLVGGTLVLRTDEVLASVDRFLDFVEAEKISVLDLPTAYWHELVDILSRRKLPTCVRLVAIGGEKASHAAFKKWQSAIGDSVRLVNTYGPTEATVTTTLFEPRPGAESLPIGRPLPNVHVFVLDEHMKEVAPGVAGELYIGGEGVARGYLHRPELTNEKFIKAPIQQELRSQRLYKTGDLVKWNKDGNLEFVGRVDHQIKIRGFRVEPGEIEAALRELDAVKDVVVTAHDGRRGQKRLVAYVIPADASQAAPQLLRSELKRKLPDYMVPSAFVSVSAFPLTPAGKLDRAALPEPGIERPDLGQEYVAPRNVAETTIARIWSKVFSIEQVGVFDNFFDLGGHSLLAAQVMSRLREEFNSDLSLANLFDKPTIAGLAEVLSQERVANGEVVTAPMLPTPRNKPLPVSFVQERLWFLDQLNPGSDAYNIPWAAWLEGPFDLSAFEKSWRALLERHEPLRTIIINNGEALEQVIQSSSPTSFIFKDFSEIPDDQRESAVKAYLGATVKDTFDLEHGPLAKAILARLTPEKHAFALILHHTICDGWSLGILLRELAQLYDASATRSGDCRLPEVALQYADYAAWLRGHMQGAFLDSELAFWRQNLHGAPTSILLPRDSSASAGKESKAARLTVAIPDSVCNRLRSNPKAEGRTPFIMLMTALAITLNRWSAQADMVIGTVVAGRNRRELENLVGCFMNFLPIRTKVSASDSGRDVLARTRMAVLEAQAHQDCPFERIVEAINPERKLNQNPLYNVALLLQNYPEELFDSHQLEVSPMRLPLDAPLLDLRFEAVQQGDALEITCEYREDLFASTTMTQLMESFLAILGQLLEKPDAPITSFNITPRLSAQREQSTRDTQTLAIVATFTAEPLEEGLRYWMKRLQTAAEIKFGPYNQVFQELLNTDSLLNRNSNGANVILVRTQDWTGEAAEAWTKETETKLKRTVSEFLDALKRSATKATSPFIICFCPPSLDIVSDPERAKILAGLENEMEAALASVPGVHFLTRAQLQAWYPVSDAYDAAADAIGHVPYTPVFFTALATAIARKYHAVKRTGYKVIALDCDHTLWSGVCGEDGARGVVLDEPRRHLQEFMLRQHAAGMLLCACSKNHPEDIEEVFAVRGEMPLKRHHIAAWRLNWLPKSQNLRSLAAELNLGLESFIFIDDNPVECAEVAVNCPEVLTLQLPEETSLIPGFLEHCWAFDHAKVTEEDKRRTEMYREEAERERLRSESLTLADFIAGLGIKIRIERMSRDEVDRVAQLTQKTNQFNCTTKRRTGSEILAAINDCEILTVHVEDRFGKYGLVGVVVFSLKHGSLDVDTFLLSCRVLGRGVEHRVLARLGEIAREKNASWVDIHFIPSAKNLPALNFLEATGGPFKQASNGGFLFRYPAAVAAVTRMQTTADPVTHYQRVQPAGSSPGLNGNRFTEWRAIALETANVHELHQQLEGADRKNRITMPRVAPRNEIEARLCAIWQKLLRVDQVGVCDDFFDLGGHSLLAVRLFAEIEKALGRKLPLVTIFQSPTIEELAKVLCAPKASEPPSLLVPIQPRGNHKPLFLVHGAGGDVLWGYANLANCMSEQQPIYGIKSRAQVGLEEFNSIEEMASCYVAEVRSFEPHGPYYLGGYCFGGNVAYEMARQLRSAGEEVALVALMDTAPSNAGYEDIKWWKLAYGYKFLKNFTYWFEDFKKLRPNERSTLLKRKTRAVIRKLRNNLTKQPAGEVDLDEVIDVNHFPEQDLKLWQKHLDALVAHEDKPYAGKVVLLRTKGQPLFCSLEADFCWNRLVTPAVEIRCIPGSHEQVFMEPNVRMLASNLTDSIANAARSIKGEEAAIPI